MDDTLIVLIMFSVGFAVFALIWFLVGVSKRKKDEPLTCDQCGSTNLEFESHFSVGVPDNSTDYFTYNCKDCGNKIEQII